MNDREKANNRTLNDFIGLLKPVQQEYICHCVREFSNRPEFHRGLLPFLKVQEAADCLRLKWCVIAESETPAGVKFIRQLISVFESALVYRLCDDEKSVTMTLSPMKLAKYYRKRYSDHFYVDFAINLRTRSMVELKRKPGTHKWRVTAHRWTLDAATTWLSEMFA